MVIFFMSKFTKSAISIMLLLLVFLIISLTPNDYADDTTKIPPRIDDLRGVWVATVLNIDYPDQPTVDADMLKQEALTILDQAQQIGFNAIFLQVRPTSDTLYQSDMFPWSKYLTGQQGLPPDQGFDPLEFWVTEAHKRNIELHAWLNPYRITKNRPADPRHSFDSLAAGHPARLHPEWVVKHQDGNLYFNPGLPEVRELIVNCARELLQNYDIDGIHLDDYFYPQADFEDLDTFNRLGAGYDSIDDWRRDNVSSLVQELAQAVRETSETARFGISPFGIWANKSSNELGSNTRGTESLNDHYADTRKWVKEGYLDYIVPQLYWHIDHQAADYRQLLHWWAETTSGTDVALYIGQAAYKTGHDSPESAWYGVQELTEQLQLNQATPQVRGSIFFSWQSFSNNPELTEMLTEYYQECQLR